MKVKIKCISQQMPNEVLEVEQNEAINLVRSGGYIMVEDIISDVEEKIEPVKRFKK